MANKEFKLKLLSAALAPVSILTISGITVLAASGIKLLTEKVTLSFSALSTGVYVTGSNLNFGSASTIAIDYPSNSMVKNIYITINDVELEEGLLKDFTFDTSTKTITINGKAMKSREVYLAVEIENIEVEQIHASSTSTQKLSFKVGEVFSSKGLELDVKYTNQSTAKVTGGFTTNLDGHVFENKDVGSPQQVFVTFEGHESDILYEVTVEPAGLHHIEIDLEKSTHKTNYIFGDTFSTDNIVIKGVNEDGSKSEGDIPTDKVTFSIEKDHVFTYNEIGSKIVYIYYEDPVTKSKLTCTYQITISDKVKTVKSIEVSKASNHKTQFYVGQTFSIQGLAIDVVYTDETRQTISETKEHTGVLEIDEDEYYIKEKLTKPFIDDDVKTEPWTVNIKIPSISKEKTTSYTFNVDKNSIESIRLNDNETTKKFTKLDRLQTLNSKLSLLQTYVTYADGTTNTVYGDGEGILQVSLYNQSGTSVGLNSELEIGEYTCNVSANDGKLNYSIKITVEPWQDLYIILTDTYKTEYKVLEKFEKPAKANKKVSGKNYSETKIDDPENMYCSIPDDYIFAKKDIGEHTVTVYYDNGWVWGSSDKKQITCTYKITVTE